MKVKILLKFLVFILVLGFLQVLSNILYKRVVMADTPLMRTQSQFEEFNYNIDILIMGDSHPQHALDTRILNNSFNYSAAAETFILSYYKFKYILDHNLKKVDILILNIDPHSFTSSRSNRLQIPYNYYYASFVDYLELGKRKNKLLPYIFEGIKGAFFPFIGSQKDIYKKIEGKEKKIPLINGFVPSKRDYSGMDREKIARGRAHAQFFKNRYFDEDMVFYFQEMLNLAASQGIKVLLIKIPLTREYYAEVTKYLDPDELYHKVASVIEKQKHVILMDAQKIYFDKPFLFGDCDHLNERGAKRFTRKLKRFLNQSNLMKHENEKSTTPEV